MTLMESSLLLELYSCSEASVTRAPASLTVAFPDGPMKAYLLRLQSQLNLNQRIILPQIWTRKQSKVLFFFRVVFCSSYTVTCTLGYDQIVSNSKCDLSKDVDSALVLDARPRGRYVWKA